MTEFQLCECIFFAKTKGRGKQQSLWCRVIGKSFEHTI